MRMVECPICKSVVAGVSDNRTVDLFVRCKNCHIGLQYNVKTGETKENDTINRTASSEMTLTRREHGE